MSLKLNQKIFHLIGTLLLLMSGVLAFGQSQQQDAVKNLYRQTEKIYSTDDLLVNGQLYIPTRPRAKGSPYYGEKQFVEGSVQIKGRQFENVLLMYNLENQRLILRAAVETGKYVTILLNSDLIDYFIIDGLHFINAGKYVNGDESAGFYAAVYHGHFDFLIKFEKEFRAVYDNQTPNGSYTGMKSDYYLFDGDNLVNVSKKKALLEYFLTEKKEIKSFMRKQKIAYKKASVPALNQLMKYCDTVSTNK